MTKLLNKRFDFRCSQEHLDHKKKDTAELLRFVMLNQEKIKYAVEIMKKGGVIFNE